MMKSFIRSSGHLVDGAVLVVDAGPGGTGRTFEVRRKAVTNRGFSPFQCWCSKTGRVLDLSFGEVEERLMVDGHTSYHFVSLEDDL